MVNEHIASLETRLGPPGEFGLSAVLLSESGEARSLIDFKADRLFPLASVAKLPVGMAYASEVASGHISNSETLLLTSEMASPGPIVNPLDRLFFLPWGGKKTVSFEDLFGLMLTYSDNTAADAVIRRLGGTDNVMGFLSSEGLGGIHINRTILQMLMYYYDLTDPSRIQRGSTNLFDSARQILSVIRQIMPAYACRTDKEHDLIESREDSATPNALSELLVRLVREGRYQQVYRQMLCCKTGANRLHRGFRRFRAHVHRFAHKTGSLGGITNDVGIVEFSTGQFVTMVAMTCRCTAPVAVRESCIAEAAEVILAECVGGSVGVN